jgi:hypothetical protein
LPNGQTITVPNGQTVPNLNIYRPDIDFWTFCSGLYNPLGYDVGTNNEGEIVVQQRKTLANQEAPSLNNFIAASQQQTSTTVYSTLTVQSEYDVNLGFTFTETETERIINPGSTGKPWFLGGRMVVQKTSQVIGDTEVYYIEKTYGEIPVNPTGTIPTTNDPCAPLPTIATQYGLITTKTFRLTYSDIGAGAYLISTLREYSEGKQAIIEDSTYTIVDGPISEHREDYTNTVQPSALVCPKNQIYLQTRIVISDYAPKEPGDELWLIRGELVTYSVTTSGPVDGVSYAGFAQSWLKSTTLSERDSNDFWQTQPTIRTPEAPPNSKWVRPEIRSYIIQATVRIPLLENLYGVSTAPDINSNGIFSLESANLYARRWLLEQAGYQQSISIIVPFFTSFTNGQLINLGNGYIGLVIASEINVGGGIANKTLTIMKLYE